MNRIVSQFRTESLTVLYLADLEGHCGMLLVPKGEDVQDIQSVIIDPLVHLCLQGDHYPTGFSNGVSMRNTSTTVKLKLQSQKVNEKTNTIETNLSDGKGLEVIHYCHIGKNTVTCNSVIKNHQDKAIVIEMVTSFSTNVLMGISVDNDDLLLHRLKSCWSSENRMISQSLTSLNMEESWSGHGLRSLRYGSIGSLPVRQFYPFAAIEVNKSATWAAVLEAPFTWQIEVSRRLMNELCLSGGIGDYEFGHYRKTLAPGEEYTTTRAHLTAVKGDAEEALRRFNQLIGQHLQCIPESEKNLPIIYNEFCYTWGNPSAEKVIALVHKISGWGIDYFVIDAGWYQDENGYWENNMGDWEVSPKLFPDGLDVVVEEIKRYGMCPGIWFEVETIGEESKAATNHPNWLLTRNGETIQSGKRLFWDFRNSAVTGYLDERVIGFLKKYGFSYLKVDYNESIGIGCDNSDSLGAGLADNTALVQDYYRKIRNEIPNLVLEMCASGGHRAEPSFLSLASMNSFSDAHECKCIPIIAANVGMTVPARQNQIWCVIRPEDTRERMHYSLSAAMIGRLCLSGDLCALAPWQDAIIQDAISFYDIIRPVILHGDQYLFRKIGDSYNHPTGSQVVVRKNEQYQLLVAHCFTKPETVEVAIAHPYTVIKTFGETVFSYYDEQIVFQPKQEFTAGAVLIQFK